MSHGVTILAVDPGASGGLAWETDLGIRAIPMPEGKGFAQAIMEITEASGGMVRAYVERVGGYIKPPPKGKENEKGFRLEDQAARIFSFGKNYGRVLGVLEANFLVVEEVQPASWQAPLMLKRGGRDRQAWKNMLKFKAQDLYPDLKVTLSTADALCILRYGQNKLRPAQPDPDQRALL